MQLVTEASDVRPRRRVLDARRWREFPDFDAARMDLSHQTAGYDRWLLGMPVLRRFHLLLPTEEMATADEVPFTAGADRGPGPPGR